MNKVKEFEELPLQELFSKDFMGKYTSFNSLLSLLEDHGISITSIEEVRNLSEHDLNLFVSKSTIFKTWDEMENMAFKDWINKQIKY